MWVLHAGGNLSYLRTLAVGSGAWATYEFDHLGEESFNSSPSRIQAYTILVLNTCIVLAAASFDTHIFYVASIFMALAAFYDCPVPYFGIRIKRLFPCSKTIYVPAMHAGWTFAMSETPLHGPTVLLLFLSYACLNVAMDIKDIDDDRKKGVITIPTLVGPDVTLRVLQVASTATALLAAVRTSTFSVVLQMLAFNVELVRSLRTTTPPNRIIYWFNFYRVLGCAVFGR